MKTWLVWIAALLFAAQLFGCGEDFAPPACFVPWTLVATPEGPVRIEDLNPGDLILAISPGNQVESHLQVVSNHVTLTRAYVDIVTLSGARLGVTAHHPFWSGNEFREIEDFEVGESLFLWQEGRLVPDPIVSSQRVDRRSDVYHLTVDATPHTFLANGILVHNKTPPRPEVTYNSGRNALLGLILAYTSKDIDRYVELLADPEFRFVFDRDGVGNGEDLPEWWGNEADIRSTRNMFESELVLDLKLDFFMGPTVFAGESDGVPLDWRKIIVTNFEFEMDTIDPEGGENIVYKISNGRQVFFFQTYPDELIAEIPRRRIIQWREEDPGGPKSLGELKFEFK